MWINLWFLTLIIYLHQWIALSQSGRISVRGIELINKNIFTEHGKPKLAKFCAYSHFYKGIWRSSCWVCEYGSIKFTEIPDAHTSCVHPPRSLSTREVLKEIICLSSHFLVGRGRIYIARHNCGRSSQWQRRDTQYLFFRPHSSGAIWAWCYENNYATAARCDGISLVVENFQKPLSRWYPC
jgi:hypothetical protein